ncbi:MAG: inorganic phosphate transporter [Prevotella sp.]|nr:inorganic phosphate transporter [Prevotella sp.]
MESLYLIIVAFLLVLAVFDLFVGVSNDAVNFLTSAIGAKVAKWRTVLIVSAVGILLGALMSSGMMDIARHGVMHPENFSFHDVMVIFLAVMVSDVIILDIFNTLGLPTSTTVSLVFELLGGTFILSLLKMHADPSLSMDMLLNSDKALQMIIAIFVSVGIAFVFGVVVQYISRVIFTFNYKKKLPYTVALFGGISFTFLAYFIFIKGVSASPFISDGAKAWIEGNTWLLIGLIFICATLLSEVLHLLKVNVFRIVVLLGTFALAMAFAGNDLVNFIGVPMAGLSSLQDYAANSGSLSPTTFMMDSLCDSAKSPFLYLFIAGIIMIIAITTSKKAQNVVRTSVDLSRQDEGDEMFGSSRVARSIVRSAEAISNFMQRLTPRPVAQYLNRRFDNHNVELAEGAAFDVVRASINLVLSSALIILGTLYKLPLSTTYVTFMVAMGTSLADRAWAKDSAVFRVTGVLSVIGGWFLTAGVAFVTCALVCMIMFFGGFTAMVLFIALVIFLLVRSNIQYSRRMKEEKKDELFPLMMRCKDPEIVLDLLNKHVGNTQAGVAEFVLEQYNKIIEGLQNDDLRLLRQVKHSLDDEKALLKKIRRREYLALKRAPRTIAIERNTWFHLGANSNSQAVYCLRRMLEPALEHVENSFKDMPEEYAADYADVHRKVEELLKETAGMIQTRDYSQYRRCLDNASDCKRTLSELRDKHLDNMQDTPSNDDYNISVVYLNLLQETQELLSIMRHHLRAANKFLAGRNPAAA